MSVSQLLAGATLLFVTALTPAQAQVAPVRGDTLIAPGTGSLLDRPISRSDYTLGPGDVLTLSIFGFRSEIHSLTITPEGTVVIPGVGVERVGGLSLDQAEERVRRQVLRFYQDVDIDLSLAGIRSFKVFIVGDVDRPGVRQATPVTRVSEIVPNISDNGIVRRNVVVRRAEGDTIRVDFARFLYTGDLTHNPTVRAGDVIHVPVVDESVTITGRVAYPGTYEYRPSETLSALLRLANGDGPFPSNAADSIRFLRFSDDPDGEVITISRGDALGAVGQQIRLAPFDALFVPVIGRYRMSTTAVIGGEVLRPGEYPITPGVTTVRDLVEIAGGFTEEASLADAVLQRRPVESPGRVRPLENVPPEFLTPDDVLLLRVSAQADADNVVVDLQRVMTETGSASDVTLEDGDRLFIPERREEITVVGAVAQPGILGFVPGQPIDFFVGAAGGYSRRADRREVMVLKGKLGNRLHREDVTTLEPGDRIVVPFKEHRTFLQRIQTTQGLINTMSGVILTIIGLDRLLDRVTD